ncbi:MAG: diphthine--ammonia ligase [Candidatus Lokiarchaeota archaeon]
MKKASVLWTGGKDCSLAFYKALLSGYHILNLVTFVPTNANFLAHPLKVMKYQADALNLPHFPVEINEPYEESYEQAIAFLKEKFGITTLITGDIAEVDGNPNWVRECCKPSGVNVCTPLWGIDRYELIESLISFKFEIIFSCVKKPWFHEGWLGRKLNKDSLEQLLNLRVEAGLDICGEQGEYHTLVLDGPIFKKRLNIKSYSNCVKDDLIYIDIRKVIIEDK